MLLAHGAGGGTAARAIAAHSNPALLHQGDEIVDRPRGIVGARAPQGHAGVLAGPRYSHL